MQMVKEIIFMTNNTARKQLSRFLLAELFFHISELILSVAIHGKDKVTVKDSLVIDKRYVLEIFCSLIEYIVEIHFFPQLKEQWIISNTGLVLVVVGEIIRKLAIITAGTAFTITIRTRHEEDRHKLVTRGIYRFVRHPSYTGCLIWCVGAQIMVCNPVSAVVLAWMVWRFFAERIAYEEHFLRKFFGLRYEEYARTVPSGIPFVK